MTDATETFIDTGETTIAVRSQGSGPPVLLLHGFPETSVMWRAIAKDLAQQFTVVCADLRGYGKSGCPASTPDHFPYSKRALAGDMVAVMERLGFSSFCVAATIAAGASPIGWRSIILLMCIASRSWTLSRRRPRENTPMTDSRSPSGPGHCSLSASPYRSAS